MEQKSLIKIVVIGPESTGKSTLCEMLAKHYNTQWCPEYAREYLLRHGMNYTYEDLLTIAMKQLELEDEFSESIVDSSKPVAGETDNSKLQTPNFKPVFIDTDMYVMKVWCEFVFGKCHKWILQQIVNRQYDLYLLCNTDLPWVKDELREYPDLETREKLFHIYKDIMINQSTPWVEITGNNEERLQKAIAAVDRLLAG